MLPHNLMIGDNKLFPFSPSEYVGLAKALNGFTPAILHPRTSLYTAVAINRNNTVVSFIHQRMHM